MERGQLELGNRPVTIFVFEGLIGHLQHSLQEKAALRAHRYEYAVSCWKLDDQVCNYIQRLTADMGVQVEVITWHPQGFADLVHDALWNRELQVDSTTSTDYDWISPKVAVDPTITSVFDPDPNHRLGYGFKGRQFDPGTY